MFMCTAGGNHAPPTITASQSRIFNHVHKDQHIGVRSKRSGTLSTESRFSPNQINKYLGRTNPKRIKNKHTGKLVRR